MNKRFMDDPAAFLATIGIVESGRQQNAPPAQNVHYFDLMPFRSGVTIGRFGSRHIDLGLGHGRRGTFWSHPIKAYWLPWISEGVASIQLGPDADYFFTSQLAGCQIQIIPGPYRHGTNHPLVRHIAGNRATDHDNGTGWRNGKPRATSPRVTGRRCSVN